jgi:hypothetical protein
MAFTFTSSNCVIVFCVIFRGEDIVKIVKSRRLASLGHIERMDEEKKAQSKEEWRRLGGVVIMCLPLDPRVAGSNPASAYGFFRAIKIRSTPSYGW